MKEDTIKIKSITAIIVMGVVMLLSSCENSVKEVQNLTYEENRPELSGKEIDFVHSDSTRIMYRIIAPEFIKINTKQEQYHEFLQGGQLFSYDKNGEIVWQLKANYAKNFEKDNLWEIRNNVEAITDNGKIINTELLYWDQKKKIIYSDKYVRITTADNQFIEGTSFTSDENFDKIVLKKPKGKVMISE